MARTASRKMAKKMSPKRRVAKRSTAGLKKAHRACVSRNAKLMHKQAKTRRAHQLALKKAQKACAKK